MEGILYIPQYFWTFPHMCKCCIKCSAVIFWEWVVERGELNAVNLSFQSAAAPEHPAVPRPMCWGYSFAAGFWVLWNGKCPAKHSVNTVLFFTFLIWKRMCCKMCNVSWLKENTFYLSIVKTYQFFSVSLCSRGRLGNEDWGGWVIYSWLVQPCSSLVVEIFDN